MQQLAALADWLLFLTLNLTESKSLDSIQYHSLVINLVPTDQ